MKQFIFVFYLLFPLSGYAQIMFYSDMFTNSKLCLTLNSDNEFDLKMYLDYLIDYDSQTICWAEGSVAYKNDTIICLDSKTDKKIIFIRKLHNDIIKAIYWNDYKADSYRCPNNGKKIRFSDLITTNPEFLIRIKKSRLNIDTDSIFVSLYSWEKGRKKILFEGFQREPSKKNKRFWFD